MANLILWIGVPFCIIKACLAGMSTDHTAGLLYYGFGAMALFTLGLFMKLYTMNRDVALLTVIWTLAGQGFFFALVCLFLMLFIKLLQFLSGAG